MFSSAVTTDLAPEKLVEIVGHRGASFDAPENTLASIALAWQQNADAVEFDVHLTRDGKIVVIHDTNTLRTAGVERNVADTTWDTLRTLDVGKWKDARFVGERIPTLDEALAIVPTDKRVWIEVKCGPEIVPELDRVLNASKLKPEQTCVISFGPEVIAVTKQARPDRPCYWVVNLNTNSATNTADALIATAKLIHADGLDLSATPAVLNKAFGDAVKAAGLKLGVWTVDSVELAKQMVTAGVESITTNKPGWLREQLLG